MIISDNIRSILEQWASLARTRISTRSTTGYMTEGAGGDLRSPGVGVGRNPSAGPGTLRRITGRLSRSITGAQSEWGNESIYEVTITNDGIEVELGSSTPYAGVHEHGFSGSVTVPGHTRRITKAFGRSIPATQVHVRSFVRAMNVPARPYLSPAIDRESQYLVDWLSKQTRPILERLHE